MIIPKTAVAEAIHFASGFKTRWVPTYVTDVAIRDIHFASGLARNIYPRCFFSARAAYGYPQDR